mgnify:CR=1 FL=1
MFSVCYYEEKKDVQRNIVVFFAQGGGLCVIYGKL